MQPEPAGYERGMVINMQKKRAKKASDPYGLGWIYKQTKKNRRYLVVMALSGILTAVISIGLAMVLKGFVDIAAGASAMPLKQNIIAAVVILGLEGALSMVTTVSYRLSCARIARKMRLELSGRLYHSSLIEMQGHHVGEYMTNLTEDVEKVSGCFPDLVRNTVGNALTAVLAVVYLFLLNWQLAALLLVCIPLLIFCIAVFSPLVQKVSRKDKENEENVRVYFQDMLEKIALFKIGGMEKKLERKISGLLDAKVKSARGLGAAEGGSLFLNNVMGTAMFLIAMGGGAYFVMRGDLAVGSMMAVVQVTNYITWPFTAIGGIISNVNQAIVSAGRLERIYTLAEEPQWGDAPRKEVAGLRLSGVSFRYKDARILEGVDAAFCRKQIVGIVGESGGGKSTLLKVISGLYLPQQGEISVVFSDGATAKNVRPYVGLVPAANQVFCDTIAANICMAAKPDKGRLEACADMANIGRYVESLEAQYATMVGNGQKELSSGQEQRIGIARALYQKAQILLFDEPTANLDAESIDIFLDTLNQIAADRICIVVTHDPRVMQHCSMIYEVKNGGLAVCNGGAGA